MIVGRIVGWILIVAALVVAGRDFWMFFATGAYTPISAGELWYNLSPGSLGLAQTVIQRHIWAPLWDPGVVTVLLWPAAPVLFVPGVAFLYLFRRRRKKRIFASPPGK